MANEQGLELVEQGVCIDILQPKRREESILKSVEELEKPNGELVVIQEVIIQIITQKD